MIRIGLLREEKSPPDRRVPLTPLQCANLLKEYDQLEILVQPSPHRAYTDEEYEAFGIPLSEDLSSCDIILGVKEVPPENLIPGKTYLFFSHTIKMQPYNKGLLQEILKRRVRLIDYECLTDPEMNRVIGFGHYAGIVGAYNGIRGYGLRYNLYQIKPAHKCHDRKELHEELKKVTLPNIKIIVTGNGRVANGAIELLGLIPVRRITPYEFTRYTYREATYCQLHSEDYHKHKDGKAWEKGDFYKNPQNYISTFKQYIKHCDLLIHCTYWDPKSPVLFDKEEMRSPDFRISVIADVTCDIEGSIPSTLKPSTIEQPYYGYNPAKETIGPPFSRETITIMAVDNLPCELPRDASDDFGKELVEKVIPALLSEDKDQMLDRATIAREGKLTKAYSYLEDFVA